MAMVGTGVMALGLVGTAPAEAADLTQIDSSGSVAFDVEVNPFLSPVISLFLPSELKALLDQPQQVDFESTILVDNAHGRLSDAGDEELTLGLSHVEDYLEALLPSTVLPLIDDIDVQGSILDSENNLLSAFDVFFRDDEIVAGNYSYGDIQGCLENTCQVLFDGSATASVLFPSSVNLKVSGGFTQTAMSIVDDGSVEPGLVSLETSSTPIDSLPEPIALLPVDDPNTASVPEPATLLGLLGLGGFFAAKRKRIKND